MNSAESALSKEWQYGRLSPMPEVVPAGWEFVRVTDVARLESGHTPSRKRPEYWDGSIPWVSLHDSKNLDREVIWETAQTIGKLGLANSSARLLPAGTVVFSRTATVGKATILGREMATSQDFANYVCGPRVANRYLLHLLRFLRPEWNRLMAGSTHNTVYMPVFEGLQALLPPVAEQRKIAAILSAVDDAIGAAQAVIDQLHLVKKAMMAELLTLGLPGRHTHFKQTELGTVPDAWSIFALGEVVDFSGGSQPEKKFFIGEPRDGYVRLIQIRDYKTDRFATYVPKHMVRKFCDATDVMIGRYGPPIFQILRGIEGAYNVALMKATPDQSKLSQDYLYYVLQLRPLFLLIERLSRRTSGQTGVDVDALRAYPIALPDAAEQEKIVALLRMLEARHASEGSYVAGLLAARKALMGCLLSGELRVKPDPEPA